MNCQNSAENLWGEASLISDTTQKTFAYRSDNPVAKLLQRQLGYFFLVWIIVDRGQVGKRRGIARMRLAKEFVGSPDATGQGAVHGVRTALVQVTVALGVISGDR